MANTNMTIHTPGLQGLFQALGAGLGGNASDLIQADINRARREQIGAETELSRADLAAKNRAAENLAALQELLMDPSVGANPAGRANLMSILAGVPDGLEHGPSFGLGATTFVNPEAMTPADLSKAAFGTGVQTDYSKSPDGVAAGLIQAMQIADMEQRAATARTNIEQQAETGRALLPKPAGASGTGGSAPLVNGPVMKALATGVDENLAALFPGTPVDPQLRQQLITRAGELYQATRNLPAAINQAMAEANAATVGSEGWGENLSVNPFDGLFGVLPKSGEVQGLGRPEAPPTPTAPAPSSFLPGPPPAPPLGADPASAAALPPEQLPAIARSVVRDASGGWVAVQNGKATPIVNGTAIVSPSTGIRLVFKDGYWFPG